MTAEAIQVARGPRQSEDGTEVVDEKVEPDRRDRLVECLQVFEVRVEVESASRRSFSPALSQQVRRNQSVPLQVGHQRHEQR